ncbi:hypothetical protein FJY93_02395 [Candidatus Kaiserbacteria bacterium]|nr:hypothetical protein [Candidatus Kaiserbacteria bacterium]
MRNLRTVPGFEAGRDLVIGLVVFLGVILLGELVVAKIWHITGWHAATMRWVGMSGAAVFLGLGGISFLSGYRKTAVLLCLMESISAALWLRAVGPLDILEVLLNGGFTYWAYEALGAIVFTSLGLIGLLVSLRPIHERYIKRFG